MGATPKQWLAIECLWHLGRCGRGIPAVVACVVSLAAWLLMVNRSGLSVLQTVYTWVRENRHEKKEMSIPREVRRELLALSALLPLVEQKLTAGWHRTVYMVDASDQGGGIWEAVGTLEELMEEGRWSVRGGWSTFTGDPEVVELWRAQSPELERERYEVIINVPRGVAPRTYIFHHLCSGLRREGDLDWYLARLGASRGLRVIVINYDLAYGQEFDLGSETVLKRILEEVSRGRADGRLQRRSVFDLDASQVRTRRPPASERRRSSMGATTSVAKGEASLRAARRAHAQRGRRAGEYLSCPRAWSQRAPSRPWTPPLPVGVRHRVLPGVREALQLREGGLPAVRAGHRLTQTYHVVRVGGAQPAALLRRLEVLPREPSRSHRVGPRDRKVSHPRGPDLPPAIVRAHRDDVHQLVRDEKPAVPRPRGGGER